MRKCNSENEIMKRRYVQHVRNAKGLGDASLDSIVAAIDRYQDYTGGKPFKSFHIEQAVAFRRALEKQTNPRTGHLLSASTRRSVLNALKGFLHWLADQPGHKRRISHSDAEYFNIDRRSAAIANALRPVPHPSIQQIEHVLRMAPSATPMEKRDQAMMACTILTGARVNALTSARFANVDMADQLFFQDARWMSTKFSKTFHTWFFPVSDLALKIFSDYHAWLAEEFLFAADDALFPATRIEHVPGKGFQATGLTRECRKTTSPVRKAFKDAFQRAGLPYYHPHSFRHTLADIGKDKCKSLSAIQAWAQNLGHDDLTTTFQSYGKMTPEQQREVIHGLRAGGECR